MKRDPDLLRALLLAIEGQAETDLTGWTEAQQAYHMALLIEAGLVQGEAYRTGDTVDGIHYEGLTWAGHDFLDAARNERVWRKALSQLKSLGVELSLDLLKTYVRKVLCSEVGLLDGAGS